MYEGHPVNIGILQDKPKIKVIQFDNYSNVNSTRLTLGGGICKYQLCFHALLFKIALDQLTPVQELSVVIQFLVTECSNYTGRHCQTNFTVMTWLQMIFTFFNSLNGGQKYHTDGRVSLQ